MSNTGYRFCLIVPCIQLGCKNEAVVNILLTMKRCSKIFYSRAQVQKRYMQTRLQHTAFDVSEFCLGEELRDFKAGVRQFVEAEVAPIAAEVDQANAFPSHMWQKFGEMGLLSLIC